MITKLFPIPTGFLFVGKYSKGELETLSIGDYGKQKNIKADFLGYKNEINGVENGWCMPLSEKWVITISTQYGCPMKCNFCDVPNVRFRGNASFDDLRQQFYNAISLFQSVKYTDRLNLHYARMGEPIFNYNVFNFTVWLRENKRQIQEETGLRIEVLHPVLTTSLPRKFKELKNRIMEWCEVKNNLYYGQAGLQFSINSTDENQRTIMFGDQQLHLKDLSVIAEKMPEPLGRKYCLNFAYSTDFEIDAKKLSSLFDCNKFMVKITPIHNNNACKVNNIKTEKGYESYEPYRRAEEHLKEEGFDVIVFVPSMDEEKGLVTCGNAVLGGSALQVDTSIIKIRGIDNDSLNIPGKISTAA